MYACTAVSFHALSRARVMVASLLEQHPDASVTVLLLDGDPAAAPIAGASIVGIADVLGEDWGLLAAANAQPALALAVLPLLVRRLFAAGATNVTYIDAGQRVLAPLDRFVELCAGHEAALVSALGAELPRDGVFGPDPAPIFSRALLGFRAGPACEALLAAWPRCFIGGVAALERWLAGVPAIADDVAVLGDAGFAVDARTLSALLAGGILAEDARLLAAGAAVALVDFSQLDPQDPLSWLDRDESVQMVSLPLLVSLLNRHAHELAAAGGDDGASGRALSGRDAAYVPDAYDRLEDGLQLTDTIRRLIGWAIAQGEITRSPFTAQGRDDLYAYLNNPGELGRGVGLTRLHLAIWRARADLRESYPYLEGPDGPGFAGWLCVHGEEQEGLVAALLPPTPAVAYRDADTQLHDEEELWGVNVAGFLTAELGVGEAARLLISGLDAAGVPAMPIQGELLPPSRRDIAHDHMRPDEAAYPINVVCINGDGIPLFAREAGRSFFDGRYSIGMWWWEAGEPPASWTPAYEFIDEVWVASQYVYDALAPSCPVPLVRVRLPVLPPPVAAVGRAQSGLPPKGFVFLCVHDYQSIAARKNPLGVVQAFRRAFAPGAGAKLVIKSINAEERPLEHARVVLAAQGHDDITLIDEYAPVAVKNAMIAACDCFVSLHRSEGFGIPLAEAMLLERPVIATRYGGSLEFMNDENSYLVDWTPARVGEGAFPYDPDALWADPDLDHAATLMRHVFDTPQQARARARVGSAQVRERHSPEACGEIMRRRLALIHKRRHDVGARRLDLAHVPALEVERDMRELVSSWPQLVVGHGRMARLKERAYRPLVNWARLFTEHQRAVDEAMVRELAQIDERLRLLARTLEQQHDARHAETLAELRRIHSRTAALQAGPTPPPE